MVTARLFVLTVVGCLLSLGISRAQAASLSASSWVVAPTPGSTQYNPVCGQAHSFWSISGSANEVVDVYWGTSLTMDASGPGSVWLHPHQQFSIGPSGAWSSSEYPSSYYTLSGSTHTVRTTAYIKFAGTGNGPTSPDGPYTFFLN